MRLSCRIVVTLAVVGILWCGISKAQSTDENGTSSVEQEARALEKACVLSLRTLNVAQITYWGGDDNRGFARALKQLGPDGAGLLNASDVKGERDGYRFKLVPDKTVGRTGPIRHYVVLAHR